VRCRRRASRLEGKLCFSPGPVKISHRCFYDDVEEQKGSSYQKDVPKNRLVQQAYVGT
jgi:hypothetical protein